MATGWNSGTTPHTGYQLRVRSTSRRERPARTFACTIGPSWDGVRANDSDRRVLAVKLLIGAE